LKVPFFKLKFTSAEKKAVREVIESGWVTTGPKVHRFEKEILKFTGAKEAVAVSSGTAGLHLALKACGIAPGDEVITTPFTMAATVEAILYCGAKPVFADIEPETLNISPVEVEQKIAKKTGAVIAVDLSGLPCDYDSLRKIASKCKIKLISDAAHSFGGEYKGKKVGKLADATAFSFYPTKSITTGEGGMVTTENKKLADRVRLLSLHAMTSSGWKRYSGGSWRYDISELGYKCNMAELPAALGLAQLKRFESLQNKREIVARRYGKCLADLSEYLELPVVPKDYISSRHLYIIRLNHKRWRIGRDRIIDELETRGIGCGVHYIPVYRFSYYKKLLKVNPSAFPVTEASFKRVISLPFYPDLSIKETHYVAEVLSDLIRKFSR
jgi:dTDP-4-amino-4,6-dideoxygalactose transaminase